MAEVQRLTFAPGGLVSGPSLGRCCSRCGRFIGRARGNLRKHESWVRAAEALVARHEAKCQGKAP